MEFISNVFNSGLYLGVVCLVFVAVAGFVYVTANQMEGLAKFYKSQFTESANVALGDMFIFTDASKLFLLNLIVLLVLPILVHLLFGIVVLTVAVAILLLVVPGFVWRSLRNKRFRQFEEQLPDAFMMLSSSLQAGASLNMALEDVVQQSGAPLNQEFGLLVKRLRLGVTLEDALVELEKRLPIQSFIMASSAIRISREVGGNLVDTIKSMAKTLRRKKTMEGKIDSLTAQGRAQGMFMAMLPVGLAVLLNYLEPEAMSKLYTTKEGLMVLSVMVIMEILGFVFIRKVTSIDT